MAADGNHVELRHLDPNLTRRISRRHIALEITPEGYVVEGLSAASITVDGAPLQRGKHVVIRPESTILLSSVLTLRVGHRSGPRSDTDSTHFGTAGEM